MVRYILTILLFTLLQKVTAQYSLPAFLDSVKKNNPELRLARENLELLKAGYNTGLTPANPAVEYGYFPGNQSQIGIKEVFSVSQSFDFPSAYVHKRNIARQKGIRSEYDYKSFEQEVLWQSVQLWNEGVFYSKEKELIQQRKQDIEKLKTAVNKSLELGNATVVEKNRVELLQVDISNQLNSIEQELSDIRLAIIYMNGGNSSPVHFTDYVLTDGLPLDSLLTEQNILLPEIKAQETEIQVSQMELKLSRSLWFPMFEVGYESETILNDRYGGIKIGVSIPLWEKTNTIKQAKINMLVKENSKQNYRLKLESETIQQYNRVKTLESNLENLRQAVMNSGNKTQLDKALDAGHISIIEYIFELSAFYDMKFQFIETERNYFQQLAGLYRYKL
ncbi:MAG: TolC family protein [Bacteroidales bacterium]|nr:TolC family protein [Bacteroidales bacterium]